METRGGARMWAPTRNGEVHAVHVRAYVQRRRAHKGDTQAQRELASSGLAGPMPACAPLSLCYHRGREKLRNEEGAFVVNTVKTAAATALARRAHEGQLDKAGEPYINHPLHVAESMDTEEETCVALLHDVLEDSDFTADDLREAGMSEEVVCAVELLTHDERVDYFDYVRAVAQSPLAAKVKRADLEHNLDTSRLRRRLTAIDMKRRSRYLQALAILDEQAATGANARVPAPLAGAPAAPHAPQAPRPATSACAESSSADQKARA